MANLSDILTNYQSVDTLDSVTDRGATTTNTLSIGGLTSTGSVAIGGSALDEVLTIEATDNPKIQFVDSGNYEWKAGIDGNNDFLFSKSGSDTNVLKMTDSGQIQVFGNSGSLSTVLTYNEDGGEIDLYDNAGNIATLIDQAYNSTRVLELIDGSNLLLGLGGSNSTGQILFHGPGYSQTAGINSSGLYLTSLKSQTWQTGSTTLTLTPTSGATDSFVYNTSNAAIYSFKSNSVEALKINGSSNVIHSGGAFFHGEDAHDTASITGTSSTSITTSGIATSNSTFAGAANEYRTWLIVVRVHYNSSVYYHEAIGSCVLSGLFWNASGTAWHDIVLNHHNGSSIACQIQFDTAGAGAAQQLRIKTITGSFAFTGGVYFTGIRLY